MTELDKPIHVSGLAIMEEQRVTLKTTLAKLVNSPLYDEGPISLSGMMSKV